MGKAIFRQSSNILGVGVVSNCGVVTAEQLFGLGEIAREIQAIGCKFSTRQTLIFLIEEEKLAEFKEKVENLGLRIGVFGEVVRNVKACAGNEKFCPRALSNALDLGVKLQNEFMNQEVPHDFKISVAGCSRGCTDPLCADFGVIATGHEKYSVYIGGKGSSTNPIHGRLILARITEESIPNVLNYVLEQYRNLAKPKERLVSTVERVGLENFIPPQDLFEIQEEKVDKDFLDLLSDSN